MVNRCSINEDIACGLLPDDIMVSRYYMYILPKIHKPENPGRPSVSSCGAPTKGISYFVDFHLGSLVKKIPSYIKDMTDVLIKFNTVRKMPIGTTLATLDVTSLYTNIPHKEGIEACRTVLEAREVQQPPTNNLTN